ncbi:hypothetical protein [Rhizobium sp. SSA_523]|nr:hypothetical protein [Rhizobium sp. SSA_523]WKC23966.1 hypothetical protein QTJ18_24895 [Rhizobium sp. SSA_523]
MKKTWILAAVLALVVAVVIFGSRPFTQSDQEAGQPSPHAITN